MRGERTEEGGKSGKGGERNQKRNKSGWEAESG